MISLKCGISKKIQMKLFVKQKRDSQTQKTNLQLPMGKGKGINQEIGINT